MAKYIIVKEPGVLYPLVWYAYKEHWWGRERIRESLSLQSANDCENSLRDFLSKDIIKKSKADIKTIEI